MIRPRLARREPGVFFAFRRVAKRGFFCVGHSVQSSIEMRAWEDADDVDDAHFALRTTRKKKKTA